MKQGYVYVVEAVGAGFVKVGITATDPLGRVKALQTGCPYELRVAALRKVSSASALEEYIHEWLAPWRGIGEWFQLKVATVVMVLDWAAQYNTDPGREFQDDPERWQRAARKLVTDWERWTQ